VWRPEDGDFWATILVPDMLEGKSRALKTRMIV